MGALSDFLSDMDLVDFFETMKSQGWFEYIFPFMLIYVIVFTSLKQVEIFKEKKSVRIIISVVIGLFAVAFPINETGDTIGVFLQGLFPGVTAFSLGILALYIIAGLLDVDLLEFLGRTKKDKKIMQIVLPILGMLFVVFYFGKGFGWWDETTIGDEFDWLIEFITDPLLWVLIVFGLVMFWVNKDDEKNLSDKSKSSKDKDSKSVEV
jgi:hypothetical protein